MALRWSVAARLWSRVRGKDKNHISEKWAQERGSEAQGSFKQGLWGMPFDVLLLATEKTRCIRELNQESRMGVAERRARTSEVTMVIGGS